MNSFRIYYKENDYEAIKTGFSWPGFFFGFIWAFVKGLPGIGTLLAGVALLLWSFSYEAQSAQNGLALLVIAALNSAIDLIVGVNGNGWRRSKITKKGYIFLTKIDAISADAAIALIPESLKPINTQPVPENKKTIINIGEKHYRALPAERGDAFCAGCGAVSSLSALYREDFSDNYYHEICIPQR